MTLYGTRLTYVYTSQEEIERLFETEAADQFLSDLTSNTEFWTELIERATTRVNQYLSGLYDEADLVNSIWVRERATYIATHFLSIRKGNPGVFNYQYEEALQELMAVKQGDIYIDLPQSGGVRPIMQNVMHDNRFSVGAIRIVSATSSRTLPGQRNLAYLRPFGWW